MGDEEIVFEPSGVLDLHMSVRLVLADSSKKYGQEEKGVIAINKNTGERRNYESVIECSIAYLFHY